MFKVATTRRGALYELITAVVVTGVCVCMVALAIDWLFSNVTHTTRPYLGMIFAGVVMLWAATCSLGLLYVYAAARNLHKLCS